MRKAPFVVQVDQMLEPIYSDYLARLNKIGADFETALENKDKKLIRNYAHQVAGNGASYGLEELGNIAREIETLASDEIWQDEKLTQNIQSFTSFLKYLKIVFN